VKKFGLRSILGLGVASMSIVGCNGSDASLDTLESSAMASVELPSAAETERRTSKSGSTLGKPNAAQVQSRFTPSDDATFDDLIAEALVAAEADGWSPEQFTPTGYLDTREIDGLKVELDVFVAEESGVVIVQLTG